jgi:hypothetical protein
MTATHDEVPIYENMFMRPTEDEVPTASLGRSVKLMQEGIQRNAFNHWEEGDLWWKPCKHELVESWKLDQCSACKRNLGADRLREEKEFGKGAEKEDEINGVKPHEVYLRSMGVSITWLLAFTFDHDCWDFETWKVVRDIVQPATRNRNRCRYAELSEMQKYTGPATIFISHCWAAKWGDLVCAACLGARKDRMVWIDVFAVRQWSGNHADLNFRGVIRQCTAVLVSSSIVRKLAEWESDENAENVRKEFVSNTDNKDIQDGKKIIFALRLWCIVEMAAAVMYDVPVVVKCGRAERVKKQGLSCYTYGGQEDETGNAPPMMANLKLMVDTKNSECAVEADKIREMEYIEEVGGIKEVDKLVVGVLSGAVSRNNGRGRDEVDAYLCGEPESLRAMNWDEANNAACVFQTVAGRGHTSLFIELLDGKLGHNNNRDWIKKVVCDSTAMWEAASAGHEGIVQLLLNGGWVDKIDVDELIVACEEGHVQVVNMMLKAGANPNEVESTEDSDGCTPLISACKENHAEVVQLLLDAGADPTLKNEKGETALVIQLDTVAKFVEDPNEFSASGTNGKECLAVLCLLEDAKKNFEKEGKKKCCKIC